MARPLSFNDFEINKFAGLDLRGPLELMPEKTLSKCMNFEVGLLGELRKRPGIVMQHNGSTFTAPANGVKLLGECSSTTVHDLVAQTDTGASGGKIYRSQDSGVTWTQISTPAATLYNAGKGVQYGGMIHMLSLAGLLRWDGTTFTVFGDPAIPRSFYRGVVLQDRLFALENSTRFIRFSNVADFGNWPSGNSIGFSAEDKDQLIGIIAYRDRLVTLRQNSINVIYLNGPPSSWTVKQLPFNVGVPNENCAVVYNDLLYLLSYDGVYRTDLTQIEEISKPIAPIFLKRRKAVFGFFQKYNDGMAYYNGRIICSIITDTNIFRMMVFNIDNNTWTEWSPNIPGQDGYAWDPPKDMFSMQIGRKVGGGPSYQKEGIYYSTSSTTGKIYFMDDQNPVYGDDTSGSSPIQTVVRTKSTDADIPAGQKRCARFSVRARKSGALANLNGLFSVNGVDGATFPVPVDITSKQTRLKGPGWFRQLAFEMSDSSTNYIEVEDFVVSIKKKSDITESST
jgi:hypothetical protein